VLIDLTAVIKNTRMIAAVLIGGRLLPKKALARMLDDVEAAVKQGK
jgi:hypothetical protein